MFQIDDYGIGADAWDSPVYFEIMGRVKLVDNENGRQIWEGEVYDIITVPKALVTMGILVENTTTPAQLAQLPASDMDSVLRGLSGYAAERVIAPLREAYNQTLPREEARMDNRQVAFN